MAIFVVIIQPLSQTLGHTSFTDLISYFDVLGVFQYQIEIQGPKPSYANPSSMDIISHFP